MANEKGLGKFGLSPQEIEEHRKRFLNKRYIDKTAVPLSPKAIAKLRGLDTPKDPK